MLKYLIILFYLINKINSWNWDNYPSPREYNYWKCNVNKETYVCDPDKMLNDEQRKEIVELVENFKEKTKRPNSRNKCMKEGLRLVVALAEDKITEIRSPDTTELCYNVRKWIPNGGCESYVFGIELNKEGFRYCYFMFSPSALYEEDYKNFNRTLEDYIEDKNYFVALKKYIEYLRILTIHRYSIFDINAFPKENNISSLEIQQLILNFNKTLNESNSEIFKINSLIKEGNKSLLMINKSLNNILFNNNNNEIKISSEKIVNALILLVILIICISIIYLFYKVRQFEQFLKNRSNCIELNEHRKDNKKQEKEEENLKITKQLINL